MATGDRDGVLPSWSSESTTGISENVSSTADVVVIQHSRIQYAEAIPSQRYNMRPRVLFELSCVCLVGYTAKITSGIPGYYGNSLIMKESTYQSLEDCIGNTPLVRLQRLPGQTTNTLLAKLEGNNPAGSVKDRPAYNMIHQAQLRGDIKPGDTLIEATSGNTGIALAMVAAMLGYRMILIMPDNMTEERRAAMKAYGAELILVSREQSMEGARDLAHHMQSQGEGKVLDQFNNEDNPDSHYTGTGPEIWRDTQGEVTHFVSSMGTTGTIMGVSRYLKEKDAAVQIVGVQPEEGSSIPGIRRWPEAYLPGIFKAARVDRTLDVNQQLAEQTSRDLAAKEGIFCGISSGGAVAAALQLSQELENAVIVSIICDRGDRYLSSGVFRS